MWVVAVIVVAVISWVVTIVATFVGVDRGSPPDQTARAQLYAILLGWSTLVWLVPYILVRLAILFGRLVKRADLFALIPFTPTAVFIWLKVRLRRKKPKAKLGL